MNAFPLDDCYTHSNVDRIGAFYKLQVRVTDGTFSNVATVLVNVETSENSGLVFQKAIYEGSIMENSTKITTVTVVNVIGSALNEHIEFRLLNPTDMFRIGLTSGVIETTGKRFDRELQQNYELVVEARSYAPYREQPRVAHVIVNVTILDINDNCPMFVNLPYYAIVSVDAARGSVITKVHALDADSYENGEVRYEMKRGHGELFKVDRKTGEVTLKQTLEGHNRDFELLIAAYDGGITPCSTDVTVHVKVSILLCLLFTFIALYSLCPPPPPISFLICSICASARIDPIFKSGLLIERTERKIGDSNKAWCAHKITAIKSIKHSTMQNVVRIVFGYNGLQNKEILNSVRFDVSIYIGRTECACTHRYMLMAL